MFMSINMINMRAMVNIPQHLCLIYAIENPTKGIMAPTSKAGVIHSIVCILRSNSTSMKKTVAIIANGKINQDSFLSNLLSRRFIFLKFTFLS